MSMSGPSPTPPNELPLPKLAAACRRETQRYLNGKESDSRFCLEIFRRALAVGAARPGYQAPVFVDEDARTVLVTIYSEFIKAQINRKAVVPLSMEDMVQQVWLRFWQAARSGLSFPSLERALAYLQLTTATAIIEEQRQRRKRWREQSLERLIEEVGEGAAVAGEDVFSELVLARFDARCRELLTDPLERRVFWMRNSMGKKPNQIAVGLTSEGVLIKGQPPTARSVSDLIDRIFQRLKVDPEIRDLLAGE